ncbi:MAG: serine/threonine-protein phosphatase [Anaerolineales bacterium]|nr:serine/threonine-protein phosphatase [Anaerolineales bacterium]
MKKFIPEIESSGLSVIGPVREDNQDSIHLSDDEHPAGPGLLYALADGMGGYAHGGVASLLALESFFNVVASQNGSPVYRTLERGVEAANLQVYQKARQLDAGRMGTTLTGAYVFGDMLYLAHVGDSRAYLIRDGHSICLTSDHTTVGDMVRAKLIPSEKIRSHAQRSVLTKSIGTSLFVQPDIIQKKLREGDRLILCSDGVWSAIEDEDFAQVTNEASSVAEISQNLIDLALDNNTDDNASVVVFHLRKLTPVVAAQESDKRESVGWFQKLRNLVS